MTSFQYRGCISSAKTLLDRIHSTSGKGGCGGMEGLKHTLRKRACCRCLVSGRTGYVSCETECIESQCEGV